MKAPRPAWLAAALLSTTMAVTAAESGPIPAAPLPDTGAALIRVVGALLLVFALLFGGVWLAKNWRRLALRKGRTPKLRLLEAQSLGGRQGVYVLAYEQQRFLIAASSNGVSLLSHLPEAEPGAEPADAVPAPVSFMQALQAVASRTS